MGVLILEFGNVKGLVMSEIVKIMMSEEPLWTNHKFRMLGVSKTLTLVEFSLFANLTTTKNPHFQSLEN